MPYKADKTKGIMKLLLIHNSANNKASGFENYLFWVRKKVLLFFIFMLFIQPLGMAQTINLDSLLTPEEIAWFNNNKHNIRYAPNPSWIPGDYIEDGVHKGIVSDYIKIFEQKLGVTFQRVYYQSWTGIIEGLKYSEVDFVGAIQQTTDRDAYLCFTQPFHKNTLGIVVRTNYEHPLTNEHIGTMKLACIENYTSTEYVRQQFPNAEIIEYNFDFSALMSTSYGQTDGAVVDFMAASHIVNEHGITNLQFGKQLDFTWKLRFASIKQKPELASILDKLLSTITEDQRKEIVNRWLLFDIIEKPSFYERNKMLVWGALTILILFILLAIIINLYLKKQVRIRTVELTTARNNAIRNEEAARDLFEKHAVVKLIIDPKTGNIVNANKAAASFYGWSEETLKRMNIFQINTLPVDILKKEFGKAQINQKTIFEYIHRKADGSLVDVEVFRSGIRIRDKEFLHTIIHDITEKKKAEQNIIYHSQMQSMLRVIATKFINVPLELIDKEIQKSLEQLGNLVEADRAYIFGYDWENYTCSNTFEWCNEGIEPQIDYLQNIPLDKIPQWVNPHKLGKALNIPDVLKLTADDGVRKILEPQGILSLITIPIMHNDLCVGFIGFDSVRKHHTFTENVEEFLFTFSQQFISVKKRQNLESSLIYAKEKAEESDKLKTAFINNISHEIRTPLNGILGFGQFLVGSELSEEERRDYFEHVEKSSNRLMNTVSDYMDIAMLVSNTMKVYNKDFALEAFFETITEKTKQLCATKNIDFKLEIPNKSAGLTVNSDPELLQKIIEKLVDNAIKFTKVGSITCGYKIKTEHLEFFVKDTGSGIDEDKQDLIFEVFKQADVSNTRGYEGSGLGLTIAKGLVTLLGGQIYVSSEKGKGSEFKFTIPIKNSGKSILPDAIDITKPKSTKTPLILIAEDDHLNYLFLETVLNSLGYNYIHAVNGKEAVDFCRQNPEISIVLMDIKMPVLNGDEATKQIRVFRPELPIIATTAYTQTGDEHRFLEAGCNDYLPKPIEKEKLRSVIKKHVG